ncbi:fosfomycin resistance glutathione transferase [Vibrio hepatarius]|uniref:fosfomycin resistance glutathione transferase n=1 Tax=Vibrio hepatarius TaxID=171383 RepID=UPI001C091FE4|nr:fosfomycin resistance glutathione transferase [Vibrio hepatarius]MBU2899329.1 fosfomycin resistance glutathione transferase [Vibrio hepatarius]
MVSGLNHLTLAVNDLEVSLAFYIQVLGFKGKVKWAKGAYLSAGDLWLCLSCDKPHPSKDYSHIAFNVEEENFSALCQRLDKSSIKLWKKNCSEGLSAYLLDPDGHKLEIHCGNLNTRLDSLRAQPYKDLEWL